MRDDDANDYREKAEIFIQAAGTAPDRRIRATLLGLATSALHIAAELEAKSPRMQVVEKNPTTRNEASRLGGSAAT